MPRKPSCSGCCIRQLGCESCARCLPKYLCVDAVVTPGPYTDLTCCDVDSYGLGHFSFRMGNVCDAWSGSQTCGGLDSPFDLAVAIDASCNTVVSSSLSEEAITFEGVLPAGMSGTFTSLQGDEFDWEISRANVVENPLIRDKIEAGICPPCSCAMCLPERLCLTIAASGDAYNPDINEAVSFLWDCHTRSWAADGAMPDGVSASIALKGAASGVCGIDVAVSGNYGEYTGTIVLEGALNSRKFHGTLCKDSDLLVSTLGVPELYPCETEPCDDPPPQEFISYINETISLMDGDVVTGTVIIRDQSCGDCTIDDCAEPPIQTLCCALPIPSTLHGTATYNCVTSPCTDSPSSTLFNYSPSLSATAGFSTWVGTFNMCGFSWTVRVRCEVVVGGITQWHAEADGCYFSNYSSDVIISTCEPFSLDTNWSWDPSPFASCCPDGGSGSGLHVVITE